MGPVRFPRVDLSAWRKQVEKELAGAPFESLVTHLPGGLEIHPLYTAAPAGLTPQAMPDRCLIAPRHDVARPGDAGSAIADDVAGGASAVWLGFDRAARLGIEPSRATLESVGEGGVAITSRRELARAVGQVEPSTHTLMLDAGANTLPAASLMLSHLADRGTRPSQVNLHFGLDLLGSLARDGSLPGPLEVLERELATLARHASAHFPRARAVTLSLAPYHEAGAHAVQEIGFALASAAHVMRVLLADGFKPADAAGQIGFTFALGKDVFLELSKLRAARLAFSKLLAGAGVQPDRVRAPFVHAVSDLRSLTPADPWNNVLRVTGQSFAALIGGADAFTPRTFDAELGTPDALGRRLARNTVLILTKEAGLRTSRDPARGSFHLETLTLDVARAGWRVFQSIEAQGGMAKALESGWVQREVEAAWQERSRAIAMGQEQILGVSAFPPEHETPIERPARRDPVVLEALAAESEAQRKSRGAITVDARTLGSMVAAAGVGATIAEISSALRRGSARPSVTPLVPRRDGAAFGAEGR